MRCLERHVLASYCRHTNLYRGIWEFRREVERAGLEREIWKLQSEIWRIGHSAEKNSYRGSSDRETRCQRTKRGVHRPRE